MTYTYNRPKHCDILRQSLARLQQYGFIMFPEQRQAYDAIRMMIGDGSFGESLRIGHDPIILDVGCGVGIGSFMLSGLKNRHVRGIDLDHPAILLASEMYDEPGRVSFEVANFLNYGGCNCVFSHVVAVEVIEHVMSAEEMLRKMKTFAPHAFFTSPNLRAPGMRKAGPPKNPYHVREYEPTEIREIARSVGLKSFQAKTVDGAQVECESSEETPLIYQVEWKL